VRKRLAEERVQPAPAAAASALPPQAEPDRLYAPLPEIVLDEPKPEPPPAISRASAGEPAIATPTRLISPVPAVALASAVCVAGSVLATLSLGDTSEGPLFNTIVFGGPLAAMVILAIGLVVSGYLSVWRASVLVVAGYVGFFLAVLSVNFLTRSAPSFGTEGADIFGGFVMGGVGALVVLVTLVMLARNPNLGRLIPIVLSGVLLIGVSTALVMVIPGVSIYRDNYGMWATPVWYGALGLVLIWLLAEPKTS
jgi:hypothetical protein